MNQRVRHATSFPNLSLRRRLIQEMQRERVGPPFATAAKGRPKMERSTGINYENVDTHDFSDSAVCYCCCYD
jgi:hypothetical protein